MPCFPWPQRTNFQEPVQHLTQTQVEQMQLKYYNSDVHRSAFVLPEFARKVRGLLGSGGPRLPGSCPCPSYPVHPVELPHVPPGPE
jgi:hypothetical protein